MKHLPTFSCLFLFFHAKKVSRVIRVTSAPRAARCRRRCKHWVTRVETTLRLMSLRYLQRLFLPNLLETLHSAISASSPHFLSVLLARSPPPFPPFSYLFSVQSQGAARGGTYSYPRHRDTPKTSRTYCSRLRPGNTCTPEGRHDSVNEEGISALFPYLIKDYLKRVLDMSNTKYQETQGSLKYSTV